MMIAGLVALVSVAITLGTMPLDVFAADSLVKSTSATQTVQVSGLELSATIEGREVLGESISVLISVRNVGDGALTLQRLMLSPEGLLSRVYARPCNLSFSEQTIQPKQSVSSNCSLSAGAIPPEIYLYREKNYLLLASVKIASQSDPVRIPLGVRLSMPELAVVYGALVGSLLLVLFSSSFTYLQSLPKLPGNRTRVKAKVITYLATLPIRIVLSIVEMTLRAVQGGVLAIILIVMSRTSTDVSAPISIRVDDFWGGLLVGIFSVPLAGWLAEKLVTGDSLRHLSPGRPSDPSPDPPSDA